ncbi:hypothetical protein GCM10022386_07480 [Flavobacterium cheonhonense]|jgi:hypothetical protein|uniref:Lipoprotein n=1 Tax=Flavobacterium cheonhonense TaxID=706185 RepID=A0ABP7THY9_9FLAO|nr:hypothetical protein [Flavobacterium cheonhonense]
MKLIIQILTISIFFSCSSKKEEKSIVHRPLPENKIEIEPYDFDTLLTRGYHLSYRVHFDTIEKQNMQSLTLVKGEKDIIELNETSYPMIHKSLGYIGGDFGETFLFIQSYGSGNPNQMQLIKKENGTILKEGIFVDNREDERILLYIETLNDDSEKLVLLDLKNNKEKIITDFNNSICAEIGNLRDCVLIDTVTTKEVVLKTDSEENKIIRRYNR